MHESIHSLWFLLVFECVCGGTNSELNELRIGVNLLFSGSPEVVTNLGHLIIFLNCSTAEADYLFRRMIHSCCYSALEILLSDSFRKIWKNCNNK